MTKRMRFRVDPDVPVRRWQMALTFGDDVPHSKSAVVVVHPRDPDGEPIHSLRREGWFYSERFDANFAYLPASPPGQEILLPPQESDVYVSEIEVEVRPFNSPQLDVTTVGPLIFLPMNDDAPTETTVAAYLAEEIDD